MIGLLAEVGWPDVVIALIAATAGALPTILAYLARKEARAVRKAIETPSGTPIGTQVEDAQHVALANHYLLRRADGEPNVEPPHSAADVQPRITP